MGRKKKVPKQRVNVPLADVALGAGVSAEDYPDEEISALAHSMDEEGLEEPILVKEGEGNAPHNLLAGARRFLAAQKLGWKDIPGLLLDKSMGPEIALIEKLQGNTLEPWAAADALVQLKTRLDWTQTQLGQAIGRNRDFVANILALTRITPEARAFIVSQKNGTSLSSRHLRYVGRAPHSEQIQVAQRILNRKLSTTALERAKRSSSSGAARFHFHQLRGVSKAGGTDYPRTLKEWRKYHRQLATDLGRLERQKILEIRRTRKQIVDARQRLQMVKIEAARTKRELQKELRQARKQLGL